MLNFVPIKETHFVIADKDTGKTARVQTELARDFKTARIHACT